MRHTRTPCDRVFGASFNRGITPRNAMAIAARITAHDRDITEWMRVDASNIDDALRQYRRAQSAIAARDMGDDRDDE